MKKLSPRTLVAGLLAIVVIAGCRTAPSKTKPGSAVSPRRYTAADISFMQGMIGHHAQALRMTSLVPTRSSRHDMSLLAQRIEVSQRDEIVLMQQWLRNRHQEIPMPDESHEQHDAMAHMALMPGMLTEEEFAQLAQATGNEFDRLFLQLMIRHHEGALTMVADLFGSNGAAQESEVFRFASEVDADQRAEIARMRALLKSLPTNSTSP